MRKAIFLVLVLLAVTSFLFGCSKINEKTNFAYDGNMYLNIKYKDAQTSDPNLLSLDIYVPKGAEGQKLPTMIYVHGGGWKIGDKSNLASYVDKASYFASLGMVYVSVNYRLTPEVVYPTHNQDVASAIAFVINNANKYSVDINKISIMGHSAGGGIISSIATDGNYLNDVGYSLDYLKCAVSLDTEGYHVSDRASEEIGIYIDAFGKDPLIWEQASPINHIEPNKKIPSFFIVTRGNQTRIDRAYEFNSKLIDANVYTQIMQATGLTHNKVNEAIGDPNDKLITPKLTDFINARCK